MTKQLKDMTEPELKELLNEIGKYIKCKTGALFLLVVFDYPGLAQYISNARREDCIKAMQETVRRFESNEVLKRD